MANLWGKILQWTGWSIDITVPHLVKCIICVAPHTSNWDFPIGLCVYRSLGYKANFLMKEFWFFWPMKYLMRALGGIPVHSGGSKGELTKSIIEAFSKRDYLNLAVTPEGTRSRQPVWRRGFLYIAYASKVPVQLGIIDYKNKKVIIRDTFNPSGNVDEDMAFVKEYYRPYRNAAKFPNKFTTE